MFDGITGKRKVNVFLKIKSNTFFFLIVFWRQGSVIRYSVHPVALWNEESGLQGIFSSTYSRRSHIKFIFYDFHNHVWIVTVWELELILTELWPRKYSCLISLKYTSDQNFHFQNLEWVTYLWSWQQLPCLSAKQLLLSQLLEGANI